MPCFREERETSVGSYTSIALFQGRCPASRCLQYGPACTASDGEVHGNEVVSSGGAPTPAGTSVFTKHNWDMGMGYLWLNGWGICHLMGGALMA